MLVRIAGLFLLLVAVLSPVHAGVIVQVGNLNWSEGDPSGILDVLIRAEDGTTVVLDNLGLEFQIAPLGLTATQILFASPQTLPGLTSNSDYVFFAGGGNPYATTIAPFNTLNAGDFSTSGPVLLNDTFKLLTRLQLVPGLGVLAPVVGDSFSVSLVSPSTNSFFDDGTFTNDIVFTANVGQVTVQASSGVIPEPTSAWVGLVLTGCSWLHIRRAKKLACGT